MLVFAKPSSTPYASAAARTPPPEKERTTASSSEGREGSARSWLISAAVSGRAKGALTGTLAQAQANTAPHSHVAAIRCVGFCVFVLCAAIVSPAPGGCTLD